MYQERLPKKRLVEQKLWFPLSFRFYDPPNTCYQHKMLKPAFGSGDLSYFSLKKITLGCSSRLRRSQQIQKPAELALGLRRGLHVEHRSGIAGLVDSGNSMQT